jgi:hypothetical protein
MNADNVFINCPFDNQYFPLLKALLFALIYIGKQPQISETTDSGEVRLHKIKELMLESKYSIHDLSRIEPLKDGDLPRFNMPFECGIDFGIKLSNPAQSVKKFLILEKEQYRYHKVISDISGNDIKAHGNQPELVIKAVRDWFKPVIKDMPGHKSIWLAFCEFESDFEQVLKADGYNPKDINELTFSDIIEHMTTWIEAFQAKSWQ